MNDQHLAVLFRLLDAAAAHQLPLWIESGWAVDARLGRITRLHDDLDLAVPAERMDTFQALLAACGGRDLQTMDYGFLAELDGVLLDIEPCFRSGEGYELDDAPPGSCPPGKEGVLAGRPVRCVSWDGILWEYFHYLRETPWEQWPAKDRDAFDFVKRCLGPEWVERVAESFRQRHGAGPT